MENVKFELVVWHGPQTGQRFAVGPEAATVGREEGNAICIPEPAVSRIHARLTPQSDGLLVEDLSSTNGVFVNGERLSEPHLLQAGDLLGISEKIILRVDSRTDARATVQLAADGKEIAALLAAEQARGAAAGGEVVSAPPARPAPHYPLGATRRDVFDRVVAFNQGRDPERVLVKYRKLAENPFTFLRGTCHLFFEDWSPPDILDTAPAAWICGDLHLENFGGYKGDNGQVYFGINDFDEGALAPCTWDLARVVTSILTAAGPLDWNRQDALALAEGYLSGYTQALQSGKARTVKVETSEGLIQDLLETLDKRKRRDFLDRRTQVKGGRRRFVSDPEKMVPTTPERRAQIETWMRRWAETQDQPDFYQVLDVAGRLAGTSSLGVMRYVVLIEGKGSPDKNYLLDLKQIPPSCLAPYLRLAQPAWPNDGVRVEQIQTRMQAAPPALLHSIMVWNQPFILRELQPTQDKLDLERCRGRVDRLLDVVRCMGQVTAWSQLGCTGRNGSATTDELMEFAQRDDWHPALVEYARSYSAQVESDFREYREDFRRYAMEQPDA